MLGTYLSILLMLNQIKILQSIRRSYIELPFPKHVTNNPHDAQKPRKNHPKHKPIQKLRIQCDLSSLCTLRLPNRSKALSAPLLKHYTHTRIPSKNFLLPKVMSLLQHGLSPTSCPRTEKCWLGEISRRHHPGRGCRPSSVIEVGQKQLGIPHQVH
jgi:hypothetical protein